jgi:hypothetical protein
MVLPLGLFAQQINEVIYDEDAEQDILYGYCTIEAFRNEPFKAWFEPAYNDYKPDEATVAQLKTLIEGIVTIFTMRLKSLLQAGVAQW